MLSFAILLTPSWGRKQDATAGMAEREKVVARLVEALYSSTKPGVEIAARLMLNGSMTPAARRAQSLIDGKTIGVKARVVGYTDSPLEDGTYDAAFFLSVEGRQSRTPTHLILRKIEGEWKIALPKYSTSERSLKFIAGLRMFVTPSVDYSNPESVITGFIGYVNTQDFKGAKSCLLSVEDSTVADYSTMEDLIYGFGLMSAPTVLEEQGDRITYGVALSTTGGKMVNQLLLVKHGPKWLIMPGSPALHSKYSPEKVLNDICIDLANLDAWKSRRAAKAMVSNMQQVALGMMQYLADWDNTFSLTDATLVTKLMVYVKNRDLFTSPLETGKKVSIHFNRRLQGRSQTSITNPGSVVMLYDGTAEQPLFRYGGKAIIATADGVARLVTREEYLRYRWSP